MRCALKSEILSTCAVWAVPSQVCLPCANPVYVLGTIGIQSSLLTGFCSCVATGTTSTITSTYTTNAEFSSTTTVTHVTATITPSESYSELATQGLPRKLTWFNSGTSVVQVVVSATSTGVFYTSVVTVRPPFRPVSFPTPSAVRIHHRKDHRLIIHLPTGYHSCLPDSDRHYHSHSH